MILAETDIISLVDEAKSQTLTQGAAKILVPYLDLTSLNDADTEETIALLCQRALTPYGAVAAVCVYPQFTSLVAALLKNTSIKICTVANFPQGTPDLVSTLASIEKSLLEGAQEIDVVMPYTAWLAGDYDYVKQFIKDCKNICVGQAQLKVILETGALGDSNIIFNASKALIIAGADFIKTSTGKVPVNATPEAAAAMLLALKNTNPLIGFKAAGGIRTVEQAFIYYYLAKKIMGDAWLMPDRFRIGASSLLDVILSKA